MTTVHSIPARTQQWVLALSASASFVVVLDMLVVSTALSTIQRDLGASLEDLEWTVNAYILSFAVLLMTGSALGDRFGRRRMFAAGMVLFALASAACALAPSVGALIAARTVQGAGAALIMPLALATMNAAFPPERRGWATGIYGSVTGLAAIVGPIVGGAITQGLAWPWIFWLNVPIGLVAAVLVVKRTPESHGPGGRLDVAGIVLAALAALGFVWALVRGNAAGWMSAETIGSLVLGAAGLAGFVAWERRAPAPMLPLRLFRSRPFSAGSAAIFFLNATLTGAIFFTAQYLQVTLGHGPLAAGLRLLPWGLVPFVLAPWAGALADRFSTRTLVVAGTFGQAAGMAWLALVVGPHAGYAALVGPMTLSGIGFALAVPAVTRAVVSLVGPADLGRASGSYSTVRQLGGAFGVAVLGAVFAAAGGRTVFADGIRPAIAVSAGLAMFGTVAALLLSTPQHRPALVPASVD
jgi:EmrB/QacA subfamily drug resistance transporter